jgi:hypothetical protein
MESPEDRAQIDLDCCELRARRWWSAVQTGGIRTTVGRCVRWDFVRKSVDRSAVQAPQPVHFLMPITWVAVPQALPGDVRKQLMGSPSR